MRYIKLVVEAPDMARVPTQLISPDDANNEDEDCNCEESGSDVNEFSGVGAVAGYTLPLGMSPDKAGRRKNKPKKR